MAGAAAAGVCVGVGAVYGSAADGDVSDVPTEKMGFWHSPARACTGGGKVWCQRAVGCCVGCFWIDAGRCLVGIQVLLIWSMTAGIRAAVVELGGG